MKNKLIKIYTIIIVALGVINLITGVNFFIKNSVLDLISKIFSWPEVPLLLFSFVIIVYVLIKKLNKTYLILPVVNLVVYTGIFFVANQLLAIWINAILYIFYIIFGLYLLKKY